MKTELKEKTKEFFRENKKRIIAGLVTISMVGSGIFFANKKGDFDKDSTKDTNIESLIDEEFQEEFSYEDSNEQNDNVYESNDKVDNSDNKHYNESNNNYENEKPGLSDKPEKPNKPEGPNKPDEPEKPCLNHDYDYTTTLVGTTDSTHTYETVGVCGKCGNETKSTTVGQHNVDSYISQGEQGEVGECTVCDYEVKRGHDNKIEISYEQLDENNHKKITKTICKNDGYVSSEVSVSEGHNFTLSEDGKTETCNDCGYVKECKHENTKDVTSLDSQTAATHTLKTETICETCDTVVDTKYTESAHTGEYTEITSEYEKGYCDESLCRYEIIQPHNHIFTTTGDWVKAYGESYCYSRETSCGECGVTIFEYKDHTYVVFDGKGVCSAAGCGDIIELANQVSEAAQEAGKVRSLSR